MKNLRAQSADEPLPAPPLFSERTHEQVEQFLNMAPAEPVTGAKPGLRVFTISHIEPGDLLALLVAGCASLCLVAPGAFLIYASLERGQLSRELIRSGMAAIAALSLAWMLFLYSLAFARNAHSYDVLEKEIEVLDRATAPGSIFIGDLSRWGLQGLNSHWTAGKTRYPLRRMDDRIPEIHFVTFQLTLFLQAVAPLLVLTSRILRSWGHVLFWLLWSTLVYAPVTYWTQGGGWLSECIDAGSAVPLHVCAGFTALGLMFFQRRVRGSSDALQSANGLAHPAYLAIGAVLFVSGSLLLAGGRSLALHPWATFDWVNMLLAASVGWLMWMVLEHQTGEGDQWAPLFGAVAGITAMAAGCSSVSPGFAILIAIVASAGSYAMLNSWKSAVHRVVWRMFAIQGVSALIGVMLAGVFATADIGGVDSSGRPIVGLISGNIELWRVQILAGSLAAALAVSAGFFLPRISEALSLIFARREKLEDSEPAPHLDEPVVSAQ